MEWVRVADSLPDDGQHIIFFVDTFKTTNQQEWFIKKLIGSHKKYVSCGYAVIEDYEGGKFLSEILLSKGSRIIIQDAIDDFITHWMPLPEPPE